MPALHALLPVPLADDAVRRDLVEIAVLVVVVGLIADRAGGDRVRVAEVLEEGRAAVEDARRVRELIGAIQVLAYEAARVHVVALERHLRERRTRSSCRVAASEKLPADPPRRRKSWNIAAEWHCTIMQPFLTRIGCTFVREEHERRVERSRRLSGPCVVAHCTSAW